MLEAVSRTGQRDNTVVIFMSDHGEMLGDHGLTAKGCRFYEGAVRVPLIVSWPGRFRQGLVADGLVELTDLAPTLAELTGEPLAWTNGRSLLPILTGQADPARHHDYVRCEYYDALNMYLPQEPDRHTPCWATMYRDERHKLVSYHGLDYGELYDLERDPAGADQPVGGARRRRAACRAHAEELRRHGCGVRSRARSDRALLSLSPDRAAAPALRTLGIERAQALSSELQPLPRSRRAPAPRLRRRLIANDCPPPASTPAPSTPQCHSRRLRCPGVRYTQTLDPYAPPNKRIRTCSSTSSCMSYWTSASTSSVTAIAKAISPSGLRAPPAVSRHWTQIGI